MIKLLEIKNLMYALPVKDIELGCKFLNTGDFDSLKSLVDSSIIRVKKNIASDSPKEEYLNIDMETLLKLKSKIDIYNSNLEPKKCEYY